MGYRSGVLREIDQCTGEGILIVLRRIELFLFGCLGIIAVGCFWGLRIGLSELVDTTTRLCNQIVTSMVMAISIKSHIVFL
jgi:hypothetical protein